MIAASTLTASASVLDSLSYDARLGYTVGGTIPTHIGKEIRGINSFNPGLNFSLSAEATLPLKGRWSLHSGLRLELGSMDVDSRVKNYEIEVVRGDESLSGIFMGNVRIKTTQRRLSLPLQAQYNFRGDRGDFDFDQNMRHMQWGLDVGADWQFTRRWGLFAELTYGFSGLFKSDFHSVQPLRPMYGSLGVSYRIK